MKPETIPAVNPEHLRKVWEMWAVLTEQRAGGPSNEELVSRVAPGSDYRTLVKHIAVLLGGIEGGWVKPDAIDFVEAAKETPVR